MKDLNTQYEYYQEVLSIAENLVSEAMDQSNNDREEAEELINDSLLHETIDGHQWVIYNGYNVSVMKYSDNEDYYIDKFGTEDAGATLQERGLSGLHNAIAFWCMYADTQDHIDDAFDKFEDNKDRS